MVLEDQKMVLGPKHEVAVTIEEKEGWCVDGNTVT
jgi:hypothetical protein